MAETIVEQLSVALEQTKYRRDQRRAARVPMTTKGEPIIDRKPPPLADPLLQIVLLWVAAFLVGWPLIQIAGAQGMIAMFLYVFVIWSGLIVLLVAVSRSLRRSLPPAAGGEDPADPR